VAESAITIGQDGLPLIVYRVDSGELKAAHCNDVSCLSASRIVIGGAGSLPDVAIGDDGLPFVTRETRTLMLAKGLPE
jgi:hypothetical protein